MRRIVSEGVDGTNEAETETETDAKRKQKW